MQHPKTEKGIMSGNGVAPHCFYDFFAGGGMASLGLGHRWRCIFANDIDEKKAMAYRKNWRDEHLIVDDVASLTSKDLPAQADLVWASFPCQDLSLAGAGAGLQGRRSGTFWPFWSLIENVISEGRAPYMIVLENVCGAISSHGGKDFTAISDALVYGGYRLGAIVVDAVHFVPQSRPRLFIIAVQSFISIPEQIRSDVYDPLWHPASLRETYNRLPQRVTDRWVWWRLPKPTQRSTSFLDILEDAPTGVEWNTPEQTQRLLDLMSSVNRAKVEQAKQAGTRVVGGVYKRTREGRQRAEVRFDGIAGCLRTPVGGSSRQTILVVEGDSVRSRLLSPREAARLMGLPDTYWLPPKYNDAYHLVGDGLAVPVVRYLAAHILEPLAAETRTEQMRTIYAQLALQQTC